MLLAAQAQALNELELLPFIQPGQVGDIVTFDIGFVPDPGDPTIGGGLDVVFDPEALEFIDYRYGSVGSPLFRPTPILLDGRLQSLGAASFSGLLKPGILASVRFRVLKEGVSRVALTPTQGNAGPWISAVDFICCQQVEYGRSLMATDGQTWPLMRLSGDVTIDPVAVGATGSAPLTITNEGTGPLTIYSFGLEPVFSQPPVGISIGGDDCRTAPLAAGESCRVWIDFTPDRLRESRGQSGTVRVKSSDILEADITARVTARIASPRFTPPPIEMSGAPLEPPYRRAVATLTNSGEWAGTIETINLVRPQFSFVRDECTGHEIAAGESCEFEVEFIPTEPGRVAAFYTVNYSGVFEDYAIIEGITPTGLPVVDYDGPLPWPVNVGETEVRNVTITNKGLVPLNVNVSFLAHDSQFSVLDTNCVSATIATGDFCFIEVAAHPTSPGRPLWQASMQTDSFYFVSSTLWMRVEAE